MSGPARRMLLCALAVAPLAGGCSGSGAVPSVAAVVDGTRIPASETTALLEGHIRAESARAGSDGHEFDAERRRTLTHFVLIYQIRHTLLGHLARQMGIPEDPNSNLSAEARAGRLSQAIAERLFPDVAAPDGTPADKAAELVDEERRTRFSEWFDEQLRRAEVRVDRHFGRWDAGRGVVQ